MDTYFKLEIVTPHRVVYSNNVSHVKAPGVAGYFGVLAKHTPFLTALKIGVTEVEVDKKKLKFSTGKGFAEVINEKMTILTESAEEATEIDVERAERSRTRAMKRLEQKDPDTDLDRAKVSLTRALNRLKIASRN